MGGTTIDTGGASSDSRGDLQLQLRLPELSASERVRVPSVPEAEHASWETYTLVPLSLILSAGASGGSYVLDSRLLNPDRREENFSHTRLMTMPLFIRTGLDLVSSTLYHASEANLPSRIATPLNLVVTLGGGVLVGIGAANHDNPLLFLGLRETAEGGVASLRRLLGDGYGFEGGRLVLGLLVALGGGSFCPSPTSARPSRGPDDPGAYVDPEDEATTTEGHYVSGETDRGGPDFLPITCQDIQMLGAEQAGSALVNLAYRGVGDLWEVLWK